MARCHLHPEPPSYATGSVAHDMCPHPRMPTNLQLAGALMSAVGELEESDRKIDERTATLLVKINQVTSLRSLLRTQLDDIAGLEAEVEKLKARD